MTIPVLYFHGFASSPASAKITVLRPLLAPHDVELITPDLNVPSFERLDYDAMIQHAVSAASEPRAIVGSSLGAIVALEASRHFAGVPLVLIAPALGVAQRWKERIPEGDPISVFNYARNANVPIHRAFFDRICEVRVDLDPPHARVTAIMGRNDETVPFSLVRERWDEWERSGKLAEGSKFVEIEAGDHSLVSEAERIANEIIQTVSDRAR